MLTEYQFFKNTPNLTFLIQKPFLTTNSLWFNFFILNFLNLFLIWKKFLYKIKLPIFKTFKNINIFKNYFKINKLLLNSSFKWNNLFKLNLLKHSSFRNRNLLSLKIIFKTSKILTFSKNCQKILKKNFKLLIGSPISPLYWDLYSKKKWIRKNLVFFYLKNNNNFNSSKFHLKINNEKNYLKKLFYNNFKYLNKINLNFNEFNYIIKLKLPKFSKNNPDWFLSKPYTFLNNFNIYKFNNFFTNWHTLQLFKNYNRIFNYLKRYNYFLKSKKSNFNLFKNFYTKKFNISKLRHYSVYKPSLHFKNNFSFFIFKNFSFSSRFKFFKNKILKRKISLIWFFFLIIKTKFNRKIKFFSFFLNKKKTLKKFFRINKRIKKINLINLFNKSATYRLKTFKWLKININSSSSNVIDNVLAISNFNKFSKKSIEIVSKFNFISRNIKFNNNSSIYNYTKLIFKSKTKINFLQNNYGFLFLTNFQSSFIKLNSNFFQIKKFFFSFPYKNELQKFILKRYSKFNSVNFNFSNDTRVNKNNLFNTPIYLKTQLPIFDTFFSTKNFLTIFNETNYSISKNWTFKTSQLNFWKNYESESPDFNIKRIRFKPGYMNMWREARKSLKNSLSINFQYQYKLTRYVSKFNKFIKFKTFLIVEMTLENILIRSRIFTEKNIINLFITNNLIYVNGTQTTYSFKQLYVGDLIQLVINLKYYIIFKWLLNLSLKKKNRLRNVQKKKTTPSFNSDEKKKSNNLPKWVSFSQNSIDDTPKYLEIDYFTLSIFVIYEPFLWSDLNFYTIINNKFSIINVYNWKYIN